MSTDSVTLNSFFIIRGGDVFRLVECRPGCKAKLGRLGMVDMHKFLGASYDGVYHVEPKTHLVTPSDMSPAAAGVRDDASSEEEAEEPNVRDNRALVDANTAQSLTHEEILEMKDKGMTESIVDQLTKNSATFAQKTAFSQAKYVQRKKAKYATLFSVERVTIEALCELGVPSLGVKSSFREEGKSLNLRFDAVAHLMAFGNIHASSRVLLFDSSPGLLPAALLDRMDEKGRVYQFMAPRQHPNTRISSRIMQLSNILERWVAVPLHPFVFEPKQSSGQMANDKFSREGSQWIGSSAAKTQLIAEGADTLMIASECHDLLQVVTALFPYLSYSGNYVIYSPSLQPLEALFALLRRSSVNLLLFDVWTREQQVLPSRTHPMNTMTASSGYILSGTKVQSDDVLDRPKVVPGEEEPSEAPPAVGSKRPRDDDEVCSDS